MMSTKMFSRGDFNDLAPSRRSRFPSLTPVPRLKRVAQVSKKETPNDFMPVVLSGVPQVQETNEQLEILLANGTRILATGEKSIVLISSILKEYI